MKALEKYSKVDEKKEEIIQRKFHDKDKMYSLSLIHYAIKLRDEFNMDFFNDKDFQKCRNIVKNVTFLEESFNGSMNMLIYIQRFKVLAKEK